MLLDYELLRLIWWLLLGILLIGFAIMDGFDLGVAMWLPWLGKTNMERRVIINSIAPTWEGNQVWFILGGGAIFAAWPSLYALSFSGFYLAMLLILLALILRPVGLKYRSKIDHSQWRQAWDAALFISGFVPSLLFGVAVGNVLQGVPFHFDDSLRVFYTGSFFALLNPYALCAGLLSVLMLAMHGAFFLQVKTEGIIRERAKQQARRTALLMITLFIAMGFWTYHGIYGYVLNSPLPHDGPSNPLHKEVITQLGAWFNNYHAYPILLLIPFGSVLSALMAVILARRALLAFVLSGLSVACLIATAGISMFPFILPSSSVPGQSLLVWDSSSSQLTLFVMLLSTVLLLPLVLLYTAWVYKVLSGKVSEQSIIEQNDSAY